jgi:hypothetical protein
VRVLGSSIDPVQIVPVQVVPVQSPNELRPDVADRVQKSGALDNARDRADDSALETARPVRAGSETGEVFGRRIEQSSVDERLPLTTRRALQAFADNTPSPEQRLGIELAGIDVIV